jgi:ABC-type nitrate/sulfonate/bicarbonate transport system substrate-binding protein
MTRRIRISAASAAFWQSAAGVCCLALVLMARPGAVVAADKLVLQLHREPQFEFAGYYAALWKGFYREAGLEVEIKPGAPPGAFAIDPVREVVERRAQFGTGTAQLLIRAAQGAPLLLLAPIFQQSGTTIYYRADADFSSLQALLNAKVGRLPASNILDLELRTALNGGGIDPDKLKSVSIEPGKAIAALAERRVDAVVGSAWELPWQARERSVALKSLNLSGPPPEFYGDGLFTLQRFANSDAATALRFREASIRGWEYALQHPDEIASRIVAELPVAVPVSDAAGFARYQSEVARKLARVPDIVLGRSDPERWSGIQQSLIATGAMSKPVDLNAFLYDSSAVPWSFTQRLVLSIVAAGVLFGLFITARRIRRYGRPAKALNFGAARTWMTAQLERLRPFALVRPGLARLRAMAQGGFDRVWRVTNQLAAATSGSRPGLRPIDLNTQLGALEPKIRRRLPKAVQCRLSMVSEPLLCHADRNSTGKTILSLVTEAAAEMPNGGQLVVGARQWTLGARESVDYPGSTPGDYARITVKDTGPGLSPARLDRIYYPDTTPRRAVAAAWQSMRRLGGFTAVESAEGIGTAVHLYFRLAGDGGKIANSPVVEDMQAMAAE